MQLGVAAVVDEGVGRLLLLLLLLLLSGDADAFEGGYYSFDVLLLLQLLMAQRRGAVVGRRS